LQTIPKIRHDFCIIKTMKPLSPLHRLLPLILALSLQPQIFSHQPSDFSLPKSFPELGVKIPVLNRAVALPERLPQTHMLFFHDADGDFRLDFFSPLEMWHLHQLVGQWIDAEGNLVRLARVTHRPPEHGAPMLTHDDFNALVLGDQNRLNANSPRAELLEWVETFTRSTVLNTREIMINRFALDDALHLALDDAGSRCGELAADKSSGHAELPVHRDDYDFSACTDMFFQDTDVLMLYSSRFDGIEDPDGDANRQLGVGDLRAQAWFEPFGNVTARDPHRGFRR